MMSRLDFRVAAVAVAVAVAVVVVDERTSR